MAEQHPLEAEESADFERGYDAGSRMAWRLILSDCLKHLGYEGSEAEHRRWISEREAAIAMLRDLCAEHGDNDWPDTLHLADIIEKHLWRHLP